MAPQCPESTSEPPFTSPSPSVVTPSLSKLAHVEHAGAPLRISASRPASDGAPNPADTTNDTLKYSLLGPSLTKAGQDAVDQKKVAETIYDASKGSKFFKNEEARDRNLTTRIAGILAKKAQFEKLDLTHELRKADEYLAELEAGRDLSQVVVHIDCDAFYAAVEELDRPELKDVPMAVGKGVLTTCNYHARKFGCRSGMAGFVAMKLCPQLICIPLNFEKYAAKAEEVRAVLAEYDPRFESASCDEAYLNLTRYCEEHRMDPDDAVQQLRAEVHERTKVTVSAGIAANAKLAKIASNINKPNGQYRIASDRQTIMDFMRTLPTRKVNGIGRVFERELDAIGVKTCGDIYAQRAYLTHLFGQKAFQFLMQCFLGLGRTKIQPSEEYERKSVGTESTFSEMSSPIALRNKLRHIAEELEGDLKRTEYRGRTLCLKIKLHTFEVLTRQTAPPFAVQAADDLYKYSLPMLEKLMKEIPNMTLRLMGLRVTNIVSTKKPAIDFFGRHRASAVATKQKLTQKDSTEDGEWESWPEAEFEEAARQERDDEMNAVEQLSQEHQDSNGEQAEQTQKPEWTCPICTLPQLPDDKSFNSHIDFCLSKQTIKEAVKDTTPRDRTSNLAAKPILGKGKGKRGRPKVEASTLDKGREKRRAFFFASGT